MSFLSGLRLGNVQLIAWPEKIAIIFLSFGLGILTASFYPAFLFFLVGLITVGILGFWVTIFRPKFIFLIFALFVFFCSGIYFLWRSEEIINNFSKPIFSGKGVIMDNPKSYGKIFRFLVKTESNEKIQMTFSDFKNQTVFNAGDKIFFKNCSLKSESENFYKDYLLSQGISGKCDFPEIVLLEKGNLKFWENPFRFVSDFLKEKIKYVLSGSEADFAVGLLLGDKVEISPQFKDEMKKSGTSHLVALSGYNISLIACFSMAMLLFFGMARPRAFFWVTGFLIFFVLMTGASASVTRAGIMGFLAILGEKSGRIYHPRNALLLAGLIMIIINPLILRYDLGFQLSFLATFGLIYFGPFFKEKFFSKKDNRGFLAWRENLSSTLAAQAAVLPLLISKFSFISLVAPLSNIFVVVFTPISMILSFLAAMVSFISDYAGYWLGFLARIPLKIQIEIIEFFGNLPFAGLNLKLGSCIFSITAWIALLIFGAHIFTNKKRKENFFQNHGK